MKSHLTNISKNCRRTPKDRRYFLFSLRQAVFFEKCSLSLFPKDRLYPPFLPCQAVFFEKCPLSLSPKDRLHPLFSPCQAVFFEKCSLSLSPKDRLHLSFSSHQAVFRRWSFVGGSWSRGLRHRFAVRNIVALLRSVPSLALLCVSSCSTGLLHRLRRAIPRTSASLPQLNFSPCLPARKPEGVGVRGKGKVAFSYALRREASAVHGFPFPGILHRQIRSWLEIRGHKNNRRGSERPSAVAWHPL